MHGRWSKKSIGPTWGPQVWRKTIDEPTSILVDAAKTVAKKCENDRKRNQQRNQNRVAKRASTHTQMSQLKPEIIQQA